MFVLPSTFRVVSKHVSLFAMYLCSTRILISARILHIINNFPTSRSRLSFYRAFSIIKQSINCRQRMFGFTMCVRGGDRCTLHHSSIFAFYSKYNHVNLLRFHEWTGFAAARQSLLRISVRKTALVELRELFAKLAFFRMHYKNGIWFPLSIDFAARMRCGG